MLDSTAEKMLASEGIKGQDNSQEAGHSRLVRLLPGESRLDEA
jgi:hypothetical protein